MSGVLWNCWWVVEPGCSGLSIPQTSAGCHHLLASTVIPVGTALGRSLYSAAIILQISPRRDGSYHHTSCHILYLTLCLSSWVFLTSIGWRSVIQSCPARRLCEPMDCSTPVPCPSLSPRVCSNSCPLSQWCHLTVSSSAAPWWITVKTAINKSLTTEALQEDLSSHGHFRQQNLIPRSQK